MPSPPHAAVADLERELLRALCVPGARASARIAVVSEMAGYSWRDHENRVVFDAIRRLRGRELEDLRASLPAVATRMGFPDVNWDTFFVPDTNSRSDPLALARRLLAAAPTRQS